MTKLVEINVENAQRTHRYARGWHCLGNASEYRDGKPHTLEVFGTRLVAFADSQGNISVLDAYCPHMGADLSQGTIENDKTGLPLPPLEVRHGRQMRGDPLLQAHSTQGQDP